MAKPPGRAGPAAAPHPAGGGGAARRSAGDHRGARRLRAADLRPARSHSAEAQSDLVLFELSVEPVQVGANELHVYLFNAKTGSPFTRTKELRVNTALQGEQITLPLDAQVAGPGHFVIPGALLSAKATWEVEFAACVSAFDEYSERFEVPVG